MVGNDIAVSIVVPVYNSEKYLRTCIDSLLCQTVEDYEIVCVNNGSTDGSGEILREYAEKYPDKVFVYEIEHSDFVGTGRNYGLSKARGEYIYMCDSDDIVEKNGVFFLYNRMKYYDLDAVYGQVNFVNLQSNTNFIVKSDGERSVSTGELIRSGAEYWRRMYKRSLFDKAGAIPEDTNFDDIAYLPVLNSYAKKAMSTTRVVYNYFRRSSSTVGSTTPETIENTIRSEKYAVERCNQRYVDDVLDFVARRISSNMTTRWLYADKIAAEVYDFMPQFEKCKQITDNTELYNKLQSWCLSEEQMIPKRVYLSNFDGMLTEEFIENVKENAFDECEVVVLDSTNCDVSDKPMLQNALNDGNYDFVSGYFALKAICENGGVYLGNRIIIDKPMNYLRINSSFYSFIDKTTYSEWIFGGVKDDPALKSILATYFDKPYKDPYLPLSRRIKNILTVVYRVPLNGKSFKNDDRLAVFSPDVLVLDSFRDLGKAAAVHICSHSFEDDEEEGMYVKYSTLSHMVGNLSTLPSAKTVESGSMTLLKEENRELKDRLDNIENSGAYRLALKLHAMGTKVPWAKKLAKKIIK